MMQLVAPKGGARIIMIVSKEVSLLLCIPPFVPRYLFSVHMYKPHEQKAQDLQNLIISLETDMFHLTLFHLLVLAPLFDDSE